jgi:hypothetical protein
VQPRPNPPWALSAISPVLAPYIGGVDAPTAMRREQAEISLLARVFTEMVDDVGAWGPTDEDLPGLRRVLYGLHAVLSLHREEEEHLMRAVDESDIVHGVAG